jgi:hypothetical protein
LKFDDLVFHLLVGSFLSGKFLLVDQLLCSACAFSVVLKFFVFEILINVFLLLDLNFVEKQVDFSLSNILLR